MGSFLRGPTLFGIGMGKATEILILGAGGFIGSHAAKQLSGKDTFIRAVDLKYPEFSQTAADEFVIGDLRDAQFVEQIIDRRFDQIYQFAADMGGAGFVFTGENDADIMQNSASINLNVLDSVSKRGVGTILYASSACIYPEQNQLDPTDPKTAEHTAYPADPDSEYGWEKLFSERLYSSYARNYGIDVRIARYHNIFGPEGTWQGGREKAPAALCRKVAQAPNEGEIEMWGDGEQTRSFLYIDECLEGTFRLMQSDCSEPLNIGSSEMISINGLAHKIIALSNKRIGIRHIDGPLGVRGRNSDNALIWQRLGWKPTRPLDAGLEPTFNWIASQVDGAASEKD
jgi:GDP-D-mannose 3',5'-epimerase